MLPHDVSKIIRKRRFYILLLMLTSGIAVVLGYVAEPSFASTHLSPDGILETNTEYKCYVVSTLFHSPGVILAFFLIAGIVGGYSSIQQARRAVDIFRTVVKRVDHFMITLRFYQNSASLLQKLVVTLWLLCFCYWLCFAAVDVAFYMDSHVEAEHLWIAENLASGHGYSFVRAAESPPSFRATAHEEPGYTLIMALILRIFEGDAYRFIALFQVVALFFTCIAIFHLTKWMCGYAMGVLTTPVFLTIPMVEHTTTQYLGPAAPAGLMITISILLLFWCFKRPSVGRGIVLGIVFACSSLIHAPLSLSVATATLFYVVIFRPGVRGVRKSVLAIIFSGLVVVSPWMVRNYIVFEHFIPLKTGFGIIAYESNPILAMTFSAGPQECSKGKRPLWKAANAREAVFRSGDKGRHYDLARKRTECFQKLIKDKISMGEFERNSFYLNKTIEFARSKPFVFASLSFYRGVRFFYFSPYHGILSVLFFIGTILALAFRDRRVLLIASAVFAYAGIFILVTPFWYRYRYPIEPLLLVVALYLPALIFRRVFKLLMPGVGDSKFTDEQA